MIMQFFDFEVFPHWWMCAFGDYEEGFTEDIKDKFVIITSDDDNARDKLIGMFRRPDVCSCGYNIKGYDLVIANAIYQGFSAEQVKIINDIIINPSTQWASKEHMRLAPFTKKKLSGFTYQDMLDDSTGSLKEKEATLGLNILESSVPFNKENLTDADKVDIIYYCKQDVFATMEFYRQIVLPYTKVKLSMGIHFNIPEDTCHKSTNARLVSMALGAKRTTFADADRLTIDIPDKIKEYCYENLPKNVIDNITSSPESFTTVLFHNEVSFGNGGIHSTYCENFNNKIVSPCLYIEEDDDYALINVDAASYYPSIMIQFDLLSRAVQNPQVFKDIFDERIAIKHKKDKTEEDQLAQLADKLVLNTTFGASGNKFLDLYDPLMCTSVCRVGQLFLGAFGCKLKKTVPSVKVVQTNTDGLLCYIARKDMYLLDELVKEWSTISGIQMEIEYVSKIWQRDVNNYLLVHTDGSVKRKGGWLNDDYYRPGYVTIASANAFVCSKAAIEYLLTGKDIIQSIVSNKNIRDFAINCTKGPSYSGVIQRFSDGTEKELYKANRVIATKDKYSGKLYKYKKYKDRISYTMMPSTPDNCLLVNENLVGADFNTYKSKIDYMYYIQRTMDLLRIDWYQLKANNLIKRYDFLPDYDD